MGFELLFCVWICMRIRLFSYSSSCCTVGTYYSTLDLAGKKLTLDDLGLLLEELMVVREGWHCMYLGLQLKVNVETLDVIRAEFSDTRDQLQEMLKTWLTTSDNTSWKTLTVALRNRSVNESGTADYLESKYCPVKDVHESKHYSILAVRQRWLRVVALSRDNVW